MVLGRTKGENRGYLGDGSQAEGPHQMGESMAQTHTYVGRVNCNPPAAGNRLRMPCI